MGYTHYWKLPEVKTLDQDKFAAFVKDVKQLSKNLPANSTSAGAYYEDEELAIRGGMGTKLPEFNSKHVWLNGDASKDLDHETFVVNSDTSSDDEMRWYRGFQFCKTARKPYDLLVCAALLSLEHHFGRRKTQVTSDGSFDDWAPAIKFYRETLKRPVKRSIINYLKKG